MISLNDESDTVDYYSKKRSDKNPLVAWLCTSALVSIDLHLEALHRIDILYPRIVITTHEQRGENGEVYGSVGGSSYRFMALNRPTSWLWLRLK